MFVCLISENHLLNVAIGWYSQPWPHHQEKWNLQMKTPEHFLSLHVGLKQLRCVG